MYHYFMNRLGRSLGYNKNTIKRSRTYIEAPLTFPTGLILRTESTVIIVTGCLSLTYIPKNFGIQVNLTCGSRTVIATGISGIVGIRTFPGQPSNLGLPSPTFRPATLSDALCRLRCAVGRCTHQAHFQQY